MALPLGVAALAGFITATVAYRDSSAREKILGYQCNDRAALEDLRLTAQREVGAMVGLGVASGALLSAGVLLVRGTHVLRRARLALDLHPDRAALLLSGSF